MWLAKLQHTKQLFHRAMNKDGVQSAFGLEKRCAFGSSISLVSLTEMRGWMKCFDLMKGRIPPEVNDPALSV